MRYMQIKKYDISNGPGVRVSVFASGCHHHCEGCFNREAWDFNAGNIFDDTVINEVIEALDHEYISGLSLLGGEPFELVNVKGLLPLVKKVKELFPNKDIWTYTGYLFDEDILNNICKKNDDMREFVKYLDVVVDGKFINSLKQSNLIFKGSSNQRIIDAKETLLQNKIVLHEKNDEGLSYGKQS